MTGSPEVDDVLPMFPLGSVLLPGGILPLHVFEPRYRQLVEDCLRRDVAEFGVTLITRGSEVGGGDHRTDVGTVARMVEVGRHTDGRYAVIAVGHRRLRVRRWMDDDPYPRAIVDDWPDEPSTRSVEEWEALVDRTRVHVRRLRAIAVELGDFPGAEQRDLPDDMSLASHRLVDDAPIGPADRQTLLGAPDPATRLTRLADMLDDVEAVLRFRLGSGDDTGV